MAAILKNIKRDISATVWTILMKFGMVVHISTPYDTVNQKFKNLTIQDGGRQPY